MMRCLFGFIHSLAKTGHVSGLYFYGLLVSFILS